MKLKPERAKCGFALKVTDSEDFKLTCNPSGREDGGVSAFLPGTLNSTKLRVFVVSHTEEQPTDTPPFFLGVDNMEAWKRLCCSFSCLRVWGFVLRPSVEQG